jgi:hypothetical protein
MALPTDANVDFLVCDEVQQEPDGKINLIGLYPTREVRIEAGVKLPATLNLAFVFVLQDGEGHFRPVFRLADPLGHELHKSAVPDIRKLAGTGHTVSMNITTIPIMNFGVYSAILEIEGQRFQRDVRIFQ